MHHSETPAYLWPDHWARPTVSGELGAVSCNNVYATRAGLEILRAGGNAFDAGVAVALVLSVVEPHHSGLGGGCFSLLYSAQTRTCAALDARGAAPRHAGEDLFLMDGEVQHRWQDTGGQSVAVPGLLRSMDHILRTYGTLSWYQVAQPAIRFAREGFGTSFTQSLTCADDSVQRKMELSAQLRQLFLKPDGTPYRFGEPQRNVQLADLLEQVVREGIDVFYTGTLAKKMVSTINGHGGCFTPLDLTSYRPKDRPPLHTTYRGHHVVSFPSPSGGPTVLELLNILDLSDLRAMGHNSAAAIHVIAEAMKLSFADRSTALGDPDFVHMDLSLLAGKDFAQRRHCLIRADRAQEFLPTQELHSADHPGNTSHFSIMDRFGNALSQTQTIRDWFGSGIVVEGYGFVLNNAMSDFSAKPSDLSGQALSCGSANRIQGGKTPLSSMAPTLVFRDGRPFLAIGAAGGARIISGVAQGIVNAIDFGMLPAQMVRQPFVHNTSLAQGLETEFGISCDTLRLLEGLGHRIVPIHVDQAMSTMVNSVMYHGGRFHASGTVRVDGCGGALQSRGSIVLDGIIQE